MKEYKKRLADRYVRKADEKIKSTGRTIIIWILALVAIWINNINPAVQKLQEVDKAAVIIKSDRGNIHSLSEKEYRNEKMEGLDRLANASSEIEEDRRQALIAFELPGFNFKVSAVWAPILWQILSLGLLIYIVLSRRNVLQWIGRAVRIYKKELSASHDDLRYLSEGIHWWMYPLPAEDNKEVTSEDYLNILGVKSRYSWKFLLVVLLFGATLYSHFQMINIENYVLSQAKGLTFSLHDILFGIGIIHIILILLVIYFWFTIKTVPTHFALESDHNALSRREWVGAFSVLAISTLTIRNWKKIVSVIWYNNPRFVEKKPIRSRESYLESGWYRNIKSNVVHWVNSQGKIRVSSPINPGNLEKLSIDAILNSESDSKLKINPKRATVSFEEACIEEFKKDNIDLACQYLMRGIDYSENHNSQSSIRLYDLLAGISVRYDCPYYLEDMLQKIGNYSDDFRFQSRKYNWLNPQSDWYRKWSDKNQTIYWAGIPM